MLPPPDAWHMTRRANWFWQWNGPWDYLKNYISILIPSGELSTKCFWVQSVTLTFVQHYTSVFQFFLELCWPLAILVPSGAKTHLWWKVNRKQTCSFCVIPPTQTNKQTNASEIITSPKADAMIIMIINTHSLHKYMYKLNSWYFWW